MEAASTRGMPAARCWFRTLLHALAIARANKVGSLIFHEWSEVKCCSCGRSLDILPECHSSWWHRRLACARDSLEQAGRLFHRSSALAKSFHNRLRKLTGAQRSTQIAGLFAGDQA